MSHSAVAVVSRAVSTKLNESAAMGEEADGAETEAGGEEGEAERDALDGKTTWTTDDDMVVSCPHTRTCLCKLSLCAYSL